MMRIPFTFLFQQIILWYCSNIILFLFLFCLLLMFVLYVICVVLLFLIFISQRVFRLYLFHRGFSHYINYLSKGVSLNLPKWLMQALFSIYSSIYLFHVHSFFFLKSNLLLLVFGLLALPAESYKLRLVCPFVHSIIDLDKLSNV